MATQGSRKTAQIINLDDHIVGQRLGLPQKVFLLGREWLVRRDLDGVDAVQFWSEMDANDDHALIMLMGEEAAELNKKLLKLPGRVYMRIIQGIIQASGLKRGDEPEESTGESTAS